MPIITFECEDCQHTEEKILPMREVNNGKPLVVPCSKCGSPSWTKPSVPAPMVWGCKRF